MDSTMIAAVAAARVHRSMEHEPGTAGLLKYWAACKAAGIPDNGSGSFWALGALLALGDRSGWERRSSLSFDDALSALNG